MNLIANEFPPLFRVQQQFDSSSVEDVKEVVRDEISRLNLESMVKPGQNVAICVGSRGIQNLQAIVSTTVQQLKSLKLKPFIIPAMGSHGGATSEGQAKVLHGMGITESSMGALVVSNIDTKSLGHLSSGAEVFCAKDALEADHLVVINRVKPHTLFRGDVESGLCKMLAIGLGKQKGASNMHKFNLTETIIPAAEIILDQAPVLFGLAIVENASEKTHTIKTALPNQFVDVDKKLLKLAWELFPRIPLESLDILLIDEMGKNISGAGMDPNVVGFWRREGGTKTPDYSTLILLDLTDESHGNAIGIGMADITTRRVIDKVDLESTYTNTITSGVFRSARLPMALENDKKALEVAFLQLLDPEKARMVRIDSTLFLETFWASKTVVSELSQRGGFTIDDEPRQLGFDEKQRLLRF